MLAGGWFHAGIAALDCGGLFGVIVQACPCRFDVFAAALRSAVRSARRTILAFASTAVPLAPLGAVTDEEPLKAEYSDAQIKADYLNKFAAFVRWPDPVPATFTICLSGRADIAAALTAMARDRQVGGHSVAVVQITPARARDAGHCQILYLGSGSEAEHAMVSATAGSPVLTVSDRDAGTSGGVIDFFDENGKLRFSIDREAASARRLELSSKLMDVAAQVKR